jgi:hypothetical protein
MKREEDFEANLSGEEGTTEKQNRVGLNESKKVS